MIFITLNGLNFSAGSPVFIRNFVLSDGAFTPRQAENFPYRTNTQRPHAWKQNTIFQTLSNYKFNDGREENCKNNGLSEIT